MVWIGQLCKMCLTSYYTQKDTEKNLLVVRMGKSVIQRAANKCQIKEKLTMILGIRETTKLRIYF